MASSFADFLLSKLNIHVSGACGPKRDEPIECFRPVHQSYLRSSNPAAPATAYSTSLWLPGALRTVDSSVAKAGMAIVYDKDIEKAFESALGQETMFVAIEAFMDAETCHEQPDSLLRFADFVEGLHTQPVTITASSLIRDMLDTYASVTSGLPGFSWEKQDLRKAAEEFIFSRDCFFYPPNRAPVVEATFRVMHYHHCDELDIDVYYTWNPPVIHFHELRNVITEGNEYRLKPSVDSLRSSGTCPVTAEYFVGPDDGWLQWDEQNACFRGTVPPRIASQIGAERFEAYTVPLELTARITKQFPCAMRFERIFRCALPLTVKRRPSHCANDQEKLSSPPIARPTGSRLIARQTAVPSSPASLERASALPISRSAGDLVRPPLMRSPLRRMNSQPRAPPSTPRSRVYTCEDKENAHLSMEDVHRLMKRKAQNPRSPSPIRLDSLSLARLHDAVSLTNPPPSLTDLEVRTVRCDSFWDEKENLSPLAEGSTKSLKSAIDEVTSEINLGSTHVSRHGKLASRSDSKNKTDSAFCVDSPIRVITPPKANPSNKCGDSTAASDICYTCVIQRRSPKAAEKDWTGVCKGCQGVRAHRWVDSIFEHGSEEEIMQVWGALFAAGDPGRTPHEQAEAAAEKKVNLWQEEIQENFMEFESKASEKLDTTMGDVTESGGEPPSFRSDI